MLRSSIDLGTNTCLLLIAECGNESVKQIVEDHSTVVRLGQAVDKSRALHPEAMERTLACLKKYSEAVKKRGLSPPETRCVATSQARDASNGKDFFKKVEVETGFHFKIISGDVEAALSFQGALLPGMNSQQSAVIDIGGGSTEIITWNGGQSLDIGSVRFTERYLKSDPVTDSEFWNCQEAIDQELKKLKTWRENLHSTTTLVGVAGTVTTLAAWFLELNRFDAGKIDGTELTRGDVHRQVEELKWRSVSERKALTGIESGRADVLLAGAMILWRTLEVLDFKKLQVSTRGLRFGVLQAAWD